MHQVGTFRKRKCRDWTFSKKGMLGEWETFTVCKSDHEMCSQNLPQRALCGPKITFPGHLNNPLCAFRGRGPLFVACSRVSRLLPCLRMYARGMGKSPHSARGRTRTTAAMHPPPALSFPLSRPIDGPSTFADRRRKEKRATDSTDAL